MEYWYYGSSVIWGRIFVDSISVLTSVDRSMEMLKLYKISKAYIEAKRIQKSVNPSKTQSFQVDALVIVVENDITMRICIKFSELATLKLMDHMLIHFEQRLWRFIEQ